MGAFKLLVWKSKSSQPACCKERDNFDDISQTIKRESSLAEIWVVTSEHGGLMTSARKCTMRKSKQVQYLTNNS